MALCFLTLDTKWQADQQETMCISAEDCHLVRPNKRFFHNIASVGYFATTRQANSGYLNLLSWKGEFKEILERIWKGWGPAIEVDCRGLPMHYMFLTMNTPRNTRRRERLLSNTILVNQRIFCCRQTQRKKKTGSIVCSEACRSDLLTKFTSIL